MNFEQVILIRSKTRLEQLIERFNNGVQFAGVLSRIQQLVAERIGFQQLKLTRKPLQGLNQAAPNHQPQQCRGEQQRNACCGDQQQAIPLTTLQICGDVLTNLKNARPLS